jgi:hypothetical protein
MDILAALRQEETKLQKQADAAKQQSRRTQLSTHIRLHARLKNWNARTPDGFEFSVKVPQTITHDKVPVGCDAEIAEFPETIPLGCRAANEQAQPRQT